MDDRRVKQIKNNKNIISVTDTKLIKDSTKKLISKNTQIILTFIPIFSHGKSQIRT